MSVLICFSECVDFPTHLVISYSKFNVICTMLILSLSQGLILLCISLWSLVWVAFLHTTRAIPGIVCHNFIPCSFLIPLSCITATHTKSGRYQLLMYAVILQHLLWSLQVSEYRVIYNNSLSEVTRLPPPIDSIETHDLLRSNTAISFILIKFIYICYDLFSVETSERG